MERNFIVVVTAQALWPNVNPIVIPMVTAKAMLIEQIVIVKLPPPPLVHLVVLNTTVPTSVL